MSRIEENERLSTRAAVEKKDSILPNFDYPYVDAIDDVHRKAIGQMNLRIKVIEKGSTFNADPFHFAQCVEIESIIVAKNFDFSKKQQRDMILSYLPNSVPSYNVSELNETLEGLLATITLYQERAVFGKMKMDPAKRAQTQNAGEV